MSNYPDDHLSHRTTLYEAIQESNSTNYPNDNSTYNPNPLGQTSPYTRESFTTSNTTSTSVSQRRVSRPLGIPSHPTEVHSSQQQYYPGGIGSIQTTADEPILTRHVTLGNYEPEAQYKDDVDLKPLTRSVPTTTTTTTSKTEKVERVNRASTGAISTLTSSQPLRYDQPIPNLRPGESILVSEQVISSEPIQAGQHIRIQSPIRYEQPLPNNMIRISGGGPSERIITDDQQVLSPLVYSPTFKQSVNPISSTTTSVISPQTTSIVYEKAVPSPTTRVVTREVVHESVPSPVQVKQSKVVLPVVKDFETVEPQFGAQNISEIHPVGTPVHLKDSQKLYDPLQQDSIQQTGQLEAHLADLSQMRYENHQSFENWEANRNIFVSDRLNIMDDLITGVERTLDWLDVGVSKVILFFKEREAQELEYTKTIKHGLTQVGDHFERSDHPDIMGNFSRVLKENDAFHAIDRKNSEILGMYIRKDILDWILIPSEKTYKQQAEALLKPLHDTRKKLNHAASKRQKAYNKYFKTYDSITRNAKASTKEDNLFKRQLRYSLAAREELRMLRLYNEQGLSVVNEFSRLAPQRVQEVQKAYSLYLQKYSELYQNNSVTPSPVLQLINQTNGPDAVQSFFTVRNMTTPHNYQFLEKAMGIYNREVTFEDLNLFLVNFPESVDPARSAFVIKEWAAVKIAGILRKNKACNVIATKMNNIIIIERKHEEKETGKVKTPMHLGLTKVEEVGPMEDGTMVKVIERTPGTLFTHTNKAKLKFESIADAQEFTQYVNSQMNQTPGTF